MRVSKGLARAVIGIAVLALAACGGPPPPTIVDLTMVAAQDANSYAGDGVGFPVQVSVYQLKSPDAFTGKDFSQIGELGGELIDTYTLSPGASQTVRHELLPDSRYLGVVAAFREINTGLAAWKASMPVEPNKTSAVTANIGASAVALQ